MEITKDIPIPELKTPSRNKYDLWKTCNINYYKRISMG